MRQRRGAFLRGAPAEARVRSEQLAVGLAAFHAIAAGHGGYRLYGRD